MPTSDSVYPHLQALFQEVRQAVMTGDPKQGGQLGRNPKGDSVKWFDLAADRAVCTYLEEHFPHSVTLLSEEGAARQFGEGEPEFTVVLDPVDGSDNFGRAIPLSGMAVALIPAHLPVQVDTVQFALVGNLFSGKTWLAARGEGASLGDGQPLPSPPATQLPETILSCDLQRFLLEPPLAQILSQAHSVRAFGAAALALIMVAEGLVGAHIDLSGNLTPENFLASSLIITETGGIVTCPDGTPLPPIQSLTMGYPILAAVTPELHLRP